MNKPVEAGQQSLEFISRRRSVYPKDFEPIEVSDEDIKGLLEAARYAPTHKLTEPWRFVAYINKGKDEFQDLQRSVLKSTISDRRQLEIKLKKLELKCEKSAAIIAINMKRDAENRIPQWEEISAVAAAVENVWLHAYSLGLGGYWSSGFTANHPLVRDRFNLTKEDLHLGWMYLGGLPKKERRERKRMDVEGFVSVIT